MCPNIRVIEDPEGGAERIENNCSAGLRCPWAHSKEEVLFHPDIFKTTLCEEHTNNTGNNQKSRSAKKNRCHRYYCPFAHGSDELRTSPLSAEQRERALRAMEVFPSDVCCVVCTRHWLTPSVNDKNFQELGCPPCDPSVGYPPMLSQKAPPPPIGHNAFDVLSTVPNLVPNHMRDLAHKPPKDILAGKIMAEKDAVMPGPKLNDSNLFSSLYSPDMNPSLFSYGEPLTSLRNANLTSDAPAYIDLAGNGLSVGQRQPNTPTKSTTAAQARSPDGVMSPTAQALLGDYFFAML
jgi:hypothetical protein